MNDRLRAKIAMRSGGRCESEISIDLRDGREVWVRCNKRATDIHHLLTKARGGRHLDRVFETYHLIHLCRACHMASDGGEAYDNGMLINGSVTWDRLTRRPVYRGTDQYLIQKYSPIVG